MQGCHGQGKCLDFFLWGGGGGGGGRKGIVAGQKSLERQRNSEKSWELENW